MSTKKEEVQEDINAEMAKLKQRIEALELEKQTRSEKNRNVTWDNELTTVGTLTFGNQQYPGSFYKTEATTPNNTKLAIHMEHGKSAKSGTLKIGVNLGNDEILTLARMHKTDNHDFYIKSAKMDAPKLSIQYGVVRTPANYDNHPDDGLGYPGLQAPVISVNCKETDHWIEPNTNLLDRSHSPVPKRE